MGAQAQPLSQQPLTQRPAWKALTAHYQAGDFIFRSGDPASDFYVIQEGHVQILDPEDTDADCAEVLAVMGPGDFFGELALIEEHARSATVRATEETECILFVAWEFTALLKERPQIAVPIMNALIARIHRREHHHD